jgi:hypothetical protein
LTLAFVWFLLIALSGQAQTVPLPNWLAGGLSNRLPLTPSTNVALQRPATNQIQASQSNTTNRQVGGLSDQDLAMANAVIAENTLTLSLPGIGTSVDGPGPLTEADGPGLLALAFYRVGTATGLSETRLSLERHHGSANRQTISRAWASGPHKQLKQDNEDHILSHYPRTGASD